jgi:hypothetical protein
MKTILSILLAIMFVSCSKTENIQSNQQEKVMLRIEAVDVDGNREYTETIVVNLKK